MVLLLMSVILCQSGEDALVLTLIGLIVIWPLGCLRLHVWRLPRRMRYLKVILEFLLSELPLRTSLPLAWSLSVDLVSCLCMLWLTVIILHVSWVMLLQRLVDWLFLLCLVVHHRLAILVLHFVLLEAAITGLLRRNTRMRSSSTPVVVLLLLELFHVFVVVREQLGDPWQRLVLVGLIQGLASVWAFGIWVLLWLLIVIILTIPWLSTLVIVLITTFEILQDAPWILLIGGSLPNSRLLNFGWKVM